MAAIANLIIDQGANFSSDVTVKDAKLLANDAYGHMDQLKELGGYLSQALRAASQSF